MKLLILFALLHVFRATSSKYVTAEGNVQGTSTINMVDLGYVEGKNYFYSNTSVNWFQSRDYCLESGLKIATIKTKGQADFLKSKYGNATFNAFYWVGARDSRQPNALAWDDTMVIIDPHSTGIGWSHNQGSPQLCGVYEAILGRESILAYSCTFVWPEIGFLCET